MRIKFDKDPSVVEQNNYAAIVINAYIVYELDTLPKILLNSFKFKKCLFGGRNTIKKSDEAKWVYFAMEQLLSKQVRGVSVEILLETL